MGICSLCKEEKELIKKSHIIPAFMYKGMFIENEPIYIQPLSTDRQIENWEKKRSPDGEYEGNLLCAYCDNVLLGSLETYASKVIYGGENIPSSEAIRCKDGRSVDGTPMQKFENIDYTKFKLFMLSILWRASISKRDFFSDIVLLDQHAENIRLMIFNNNAGSVSDYPIFFTTLPNDYPLPKEILGQPLFLPNQEQSDIALFIINGYVFWFYVETDPQKIPKPIIDETIRPSNELNLYHLSTEYFLNLLKVIVG